MVRSKTHRASNPLTSETTTQIRKAIANRNCNELVPLDIPAEIIKYHPSLLETYKHLNHLYSKFKPTTSKLIILGPREGWTDGDRSIERELKNVRRQAAPQLLLALYHANIGYSLMSNKYK